MRKSAAILGATCAIGALAWAASFSRVTVAAQVAPAVAPAAAQYRGVLDKYCVTCHNEKLRTAGLAFDSLDIANLEPHADVWEKVVRKLRGGDMPPAGRPRPDQATYDAFVGWLEGSLDTIAAARPNPGAPLLHRLNRTEYANAIRDLLALEIDAEALLPSDNPTHGFDNVADGLGVSPLLLESYVTAGRKISRLAVGTANVAPVRDTYRAPYDGTQDGYQEGMPLGTRGGLRVRHTFPASGEYEFRIRLSRSHQDKIRGLQEPHDIELLVDGERLKLFKIEGGRQMYETEYFDGESKSLSADEHLVLRTPIKAGPHEVIATFPVKTSALSEGLSKPLLRSFLRGEDIVGVPAVSQVVITGPYAVTGVENTPSRARIFTCRPMGNTEQEERSCAKQIISTLARRAYRGLATDDDIAELLGFYETARGKGGFEAGVETALWRMLASAKFVFRFEVDPPGVAPAAAYRISDLELASRLSFLLWSSVPDDQLLDVASRGRLRDPRILEQQVRRMLADSRSRALVENFAGQWLYLRMLDGVHPDLSESPDFDNNLRQAFRRETEMLFESIMRDDRSILDLLDADYTFVNERLARHYGISKVSGSHFRRVRVADENRRGLLGHGSILTLTSYANRTSPVVRGKWVLENILGMPPPPPPADVPQLPEDGEAAAMSMRERMAQHRRNPTCASCHSKLDPIGLGLENFNAVGVWRATLDGRTPIDASGTLPNGTPFEGPAGLRKALLQRPEIFVHTATRKLLTYALGRGLEYYDEPALRDIVRRAAKQKYSWSSLILGVVESRPFQWRLASERQRS